MNLSVKKLSNLLILIPTICSAGLTSGIDSKFKLSKLENFKFKAKSPGINFYQKVLSRSLGSHCKLYPNDSKYSQIIFRKCGVKKSILLSMQRFFMEPDAYTNKLKIISKDNIYYEDLPSDCNLY